MSEDSADVYRESAVLCGQWRPQISHSRPGSRTHYAQGVKVNSVLHAGHNARVACLPHPRYRMMFHEIRVTQPQNSQNAVYDVPLLHPSLQKGHCFLEATGLYPPPP
jgi:hypothetical protein